ncbi:hypothetical protein H072_5224 [Dactylellina haptotyla CBS 200.50]|uniref:Ubiquitin-conjugating enzyme E2-binding protein n=1 Tax=Dactylellina haptotyla (strain CBS 200.50) TaxID=1284197 RepID=S8AD65_DACHA|nr:hypothetical protein H072_5224 [Dactylellina haptotyla CBS 200.50]
MPDSLFFCELLSNIKQVSVSIDSPDGHSQPSSVHLHASRRALTVSFGPDISHVILPVPIDYPSRVLATSTTHRLPASQAFLSSTSFDAIADSPPVPWDASTLTAEASIHCTTCTSRIIPSLRIRKWKNLPSEHWADLMDLWHCHKPHDEKGHADGGKYAGVGRILAEPSLGLVDPMYFLLSRDDCENIACEKHVGTNEADTITCQTCEAPLGIVDAKSDGIRLMKWSLLLGCGQESSSNEGDGDRLESYTMVQWLSAHLLFLVDNTGQRKLLVKPGASLLSQEHLDGSGRRTEEAAEGVHVWVFNPNTVITRSGKPTPTRAVKVYYQNLGTKEELDRLGDIETVYLPGAIYERFKRDLEEVNMGMPKNLRSWGGDWKGGWLERF